MLGLTSCILVSLPAWTMHIVSVLVLGEVQSTKSGRYTYMVDKKAHVAALTIN
jgi:hypothetical protein